MKKNMCLTRPEIEAKLEQSGIQPTLQRVLLAQYILCEADHPTAEDVKVWADQHVGKISLATVYNTLNTLVEAGLIQEFKFPHNEKSIYDCNMTEHFHFLDEGSGQIFDLSEDDVQINFKLKEKYKVSGVSLLLKGQISGPQNKEKI